MANRTVYQNGNGVRRTIITEASEPEGVFHIEVAQNVGDIIRAVKEIREENHVIGHRKSRNMVPVAEVPITVYEQSVQEGWFHDQKKWREWANDPQNEPLRYTKGRL